jgi:hypothetical protein
MAGESLQRGARGRIVRLQILVFIFSLAMFLGAPVVQVSDSRYTAMLSECMLHHRSPFLEEYYKVPVPWLTGDASDPSEAFEYQLVKTRGHVTYFFGHGSSMLSMPLVAIINAAGVSAATQDGHLDLWGEIRIERAIAAMLMAGLTCIFFTMALAMLPETWSLVVAIGAALGTQMMSTATRGLWAHTWEIFLLGLIAHSLLSSENRGARIHPVWLGTVVAWTYCVRPTGSIAIVAVSVYVGWIHRAQFIAYAATLAGWLTAFVAYTWSVFGTIVPPYYSASRLQLSNMVRSLTLNLVGPGRGLLVFVPVTLFVIYIVARYRKLLPHKGLALLAIAQIAGIGIALSTNKSWTGGWCFGPRYFTDAIPWFVLLAILGLDAMRRAPGLSHHRTEIAAALFLLALSVAINMRGAWSWAGMDWNPIEQHGKFDFRYPQFMAGLIAPPKN